MSQLSLQLAQQGAEANALLHSTAQLYSEEAERISDQNLALSAAAVLSEQRLATIGQLHATSMSQLRAQLDGLVGDYRGLEQEESRLVTHGLDPLQTIQADSARELSLAHETIQARLTPLFQEAVVQIAAEEARANSSIAAGKQDLVAQSNAKIAQAQQLAAQQQLVAAQAAAARAAAAQQQVNAKLAAERATMAAAQKQREAEALAAKKRQQEIEDLEQVDDEYEVAAKQAATARAAQQQKEEAERNAVRAAAIAAEQKRWAQIPITSIEDLLAQSEYD